jgi:hypothetical protein
MQWIADKNQGGGGEAIGYGHRTHAATHGATTKSDSAGRDVEPVGQFRSRCPNGLDTNSGRIRPALSSGATGKLHPLDDHANPRGRFVNCHQGGMVAPCSSARGEYETSRSGSDH